MLMINLIAIITIVALIYVYKNYIQKSYVIAEGNQELKTYWSNIGFFLMTALLVRLLGAVAYRGHSSDMSCFLGWASRVFDGGFSNFYSTETFTDYPPGYMYVLYIIGGIRKLFHLSYDSTITIILTKMPAMICDLITGWLIYKIAIKRLNEKSSILCACVYLFHPVIILNSAIWGQVDSVFTLAVVLMCYFVTEKKLPKAYFALAIGALIKPQTLIFTPIVIYGIIDQVFLDGFDKKNFFRQLSWGLGAIALMFLLAAPFGLSNVISQYVDTLGSYPYATINGYNMWTLFGLNWTPQENTFLSITYNQWGTIFIFLIVAYATYMSFKSKKDKSKYFFIGAFIVTAMFMLSVRMHERYMFPALVLLLIAFVYRPRKEIYIAYVVLSVANFYNTVHVLIAYDPQNFNRKAIVPILISAFSVAAFGYLIYYSIRFYHKYTKMEDITEEMIAKEEEKQREIEEKNGVEKIQASKKEKLKWTRLDYLILFGIMIVYAVFALYDLGKREAPVQGWSSNIEGEQIVLDMGSSVSMKNISYYLGNYERRKFRVESADNLDGPWNVLTEELEMVSVFDWDTQEINGYGRYLRLTSLLDKAVIMELAILDEQGNVITPMNTADYQELFDEQELRPDRPTFREGTYFDEIYHARTAYEFIHGLHTYEWTHPPLGKLIMSIGIRIFGMNPFGWRIMGTMLGIFMVPIIYVFGKRFFKETWITSILTVLFTFDFMHFTQTRIATIDVFVTFFIILMYYFMYQYTQMSFYDTKLTKTWIPLGLCGISMGLGVASKWTGVYAGAGLAVIFFWTLYKRYKEYQYALTKPGKETNGIAHSQVVKHFKEYTIKTLGFCIIFFVVIPVIIYLLSYIPFEDSRGTGLIEKVLHNQEAMFNYHSHVTSPHPYSSMWYQWPIMTRPIWYYSGHLTDTISEGISAFGNPLVWWAGIPAFVYMLYLMYKEKDKKAGFLAIAYLAQYVPWFFVTRVVFIYHYFPSVPFVAMMVAYSLYKIVQKKPKLKIAAFVYAAAAIVLFLMFYPVLSGQPVDKGYVADFLRWFDSWVLVS